VKGPGDRAFSMYTASCQDVPGRVPRWGEDLSQLPIEFPRCYQKATIYLRRGNTYNTCSPTWPLRVVSALTNITRPRHRRAVVSEHSAETWRLACSPTASRVVAMERPAYEGAYDHPPGRSFLREHQDRNQIECGMRGERHAGLLRERVTLPSLRPRAAATVAGVRPGHRPPPLRRTSPAFSTCTVTVGTTS
jgi:hypothetical protein